MSLRSEDRTLTMMAALFCGYMMIVYVRESVTYSAPVVIRAENMENDDLGLIVSSQKLGYTLIKFFGGTLVDMLDPGLVFSICLLLSGIVGAGFAVCSSVAMFSLMWFVCGVVQGPSWPACGVLLKKSVPANVFATYWSILSTSTNVAGALGPLLSQALNSAYPWRTSFMLAGSVSIFFGVVIGYVLQGFSLSRKAKTDEKPKKSSKESDSVGPESLLSREMLAVCLFYFLISFVRGACNDWSQHYLIQDKKQSGSTGSWFISLQEAGGIVGSVAAGILSDKGLSQAESRSISRTKVLCLFSSFLCASIFCLIYFADTKSSLIWLAVIGFSIGFSLYGCISLAGVVCMEVAPDNLSGTAHSMGTLAANVGRVVAGYPFAMIASRFSWDTSFLTAFAIGMAAVGVTYVLLYFVSRKHLSTDKSDKIK